MSSRTMPYQRPQNYNFPQPPMDPYAPPYSPAPYGAYGHQPFFYPQETLVQVDDFQHDPKIHAYWKDRVVPRPGFRSPRILGPIFESNRIAIKDPKKSPEISQNQLPPPQTRGNSNQIKPVNKKTKKEKKLSEMLVVVNRTPLKNHGLDKYAPSFVPQCLRNIQRLVHHLEPLPPVAPFPPPDYSCYFLLPHLIQKRESLLLSRPPSSSEERIPLDSAHYHQHWYPILQAEVDCLCAQRSSVVLWNVEDLKSTEWKRGEFSLVVPGLQENYPRLELGDLVKMRQVIPSQNGFTEPFFGNGVAFEGRVIASQKREGLVHLYSPTLKDYIQNNWTGIALYLAQTENHIPFRLPVNFNISFLVNARPFCLMETAVNDINDIANSSLQESSFIRWLFPTPKHVTDTPPRWTVDAKNHEALKWKDKDLNEEQKDAVTSIALREWPVPYLISGPAGTGKTRTIVEMVLQILHVQPDACILLCAPSNPATDTLVLRLRNSLKPSEMLRLNDQGRTINQVPSKLMPYCHIDTTAENKFSMPPFKALMKYRVVACSCIDANILADAQCTNRALMKMENEIMDSFHPHSAAAPAKMHWTHLIIDEAAQGSEPELCIPISVVATEGSPATPTTGNGVELAHPQLVLCGDRYQLGPIVSSEEARKAELDMSLLQRLFERPLYAKETTAAGKFRPYAHLRKNYRSHPAILMPPSALFYNDTLVPYATNGQISWSKLRDNRLPVRIIGCEAEEEGVEEKSTWYNPGEIETVMRVVRSLMGEANASDPPLKGRNIGIISPFRAQVWKLREILREENLRDVDVGTVEVSMSLIEESPSEGLGFCDLNALILRLFGMDWQGRENRVIIVSCVRSTARFLEDDFQKGLGIFKEPKRMNVAITRAKELLVIIGNPHLLQQDPYWKPYLQFALRNNLYEGSQLDLEVDGNYISKLEASLIQSGTDGTVDPEKIGILVAGIVAGNVLRD